MIRKVRSMTQYNERKKQVIDTVSNREPTFFFIWYAN